MKVISKDKRKMPIAAPHVNLLLQAIRTLTSTLDEKEILEHIIDLAMEIVGAEAASILLLDPKTGELVFDITLGEKGSQIKKIRLSPGEGIAGWVASEKKPLIVNDVKNDPRWSEKIDRRSKFTTNSIIAMPLLYKERLLGVLEVINKKNNESFNEEDLQILEAFSVQAAISIETAQLFSGIKTEKEKIELIFTQMTDGAMLVDSNAGIILFNNTAKLFVTPESTTLYSAFNDYDCQPSISEVLKNNRQTTKIELSHKSKQLTLSGSVSRIFNDEGLAGYLLTFYNSTEEKKEKLLKRNFLSLISHKLKTPLVSIIGFSNLLHNKFSKEPPGAITKEDARALGIISNQSIYLNSLVDKLLNFVSIERSGEKFEKLTCNLFNIVEEAGNRMKEFFDSSNVSFAIEPSVKELRPVECNPDKIKQVLENLLENAVKFNGKTKKTVLVSGFEKDNLAGISIKDDGNGIPQEQKQKLFEEFSQIDEYFTGQVKGMGLGLAMCR
ncbi:MAG: GAF domain-containing sensor histidine kinase, partial [Elusimicrobiota bacterium]